MRRSLSWGSSRGRLRLGCFPPSNGESMHRLLTARCIGMAYERALAGKPDLRAASNVGFGPQIKFGATDPGGGGWVLVAARYPCSSRGQAPRQARVRRELWGGDGGEQGRRTVRNFRAANGVGFGPQIKFGATDPGRGLGGVRGEIPLFRPGAGSAASAGMTGALGRGWRGTGGGGQVGTFALRTGLGLGPKSSLGRRILGGGWEECAARYPCSGQGQAPRQARV